MAEQTCSYIEAITTVKHAKRRECEECVKIDAQWMHLRTCQTCGATLCCDDSPNRRATTRSRPLLYSSWPLGTLERYLRAVGVYTRCRDQTW